jgi:hypothetical protein
MVTISKALLTGGEEKFIQGQIRKLTEQYGVAALPVVTEAPGNLVTPKLSIRHNIVLLGCLKIAYELEAVSIPGYIEDTLAREFAAMLLAGKLNNRKANLLTPGEDFRRFVEERFTHFSSFDGVDCYCVFQNVEVFGLAATVKVFDLRHRAGPG